MKLLTHPPGVDGPFPLDGLSSRGRECLLKSPGRRPQHRSCGPRVSRGRKAFRRLAVPLGSSVSQTSALCLSHFSSVQFSSVAQSCLTFCDPMDCSTPGLPVHHQLPESTQTHVHCVSDAIQPSHPLLSPFPPTPNPSQHQGLFQ